MARSFSSWIVALLILMALPCQAATVPQPPPSSPASFLGPCSRSDLDEKALFGPLFPHEKIRACRQKLEKVANLKHPIDDACVWRMMSDFVETAAAEKVDSSCAEKIRRPSFPKAPRVQF